jgi:DNA-binding NarL/FixJ family response regulator
MKEEASEQVLVALRKVLNGEVYTSAKIAERLKTGSRSGRPDDPVARLSDRELQVFQLIGQGRGTRRIAKELNLSVKTVETHRQRIKEKLGIKTAPQLVRYAVRWWEARGKS